MEMGVFMGKQLIRTTRGHSVRIIKHRPHRHEGYHQGQAGVAASFLERGPEHHTQRTWRWHLVYPTARPSPRRLSSPPSTGRINKRKRKTSLENSASVPVPLENDPVNIYLSYPTANRLEESDHDLVDEPTSKRSKKLRVSSVDGLGPKLSNGALNRINEGPKQAAMRLEKMRDAVRILPECVGEDLDREGLMATLLRYAKALLFLTQGYQANIEIIVNNAFFREEHDEMIIIKSIKIYSLYKHHLIPFTGNVYLFFRYLISLPLSTLSSFQFL